MPALSPPDYVEIARSFGLDKATYPVLEAFAHLGVGHTFGYELIKAGALRAIRLSEKKVVVPAVDIAQVLYERQHRPPPQQGKIVGAAMMIRTPRQPVDLAVTTKDVRLRMERVLANLEPITQQRDPILADPRAVWLDVTLSIVELESVTILMKRAWWP
jgi:hypothetical protein